MQIEFDKAAGTATVTFTMDLAGLEAEAKRKIKTQAERRKFILTEILAELGKEAQHAHRAVQVDDAKIDEELARQQAALVEQAEDVKASRPEILGE